MDGFHLTKLTDSQFLKFSELVYEKTGIFLKPEKKELLNARLGKRLRACGINDFKNYYNFVMGDASGEELIHLIDSVSTNFTNFFREKAHFDFLKANVLPGYIKGARGKKQISVWSAACSSGEEPYTLGMVLGDFFSRYQDWNFSILATDISTRVLSHGERGVYSLDRVAGIPENQLRLFFQKGTGKSSGQVKVKDSLRGLVTFRRFNLMDVFPWKESFDIIFCRNVMIYFNRETQQELISKFYGSLVPGGHLFIGHSESISGIKHGFKQIASTTYQK
ncbi:MAG: protein-glutamate O-methyltransferase [Proteobacteria bacterium]|nr:protein-glutamate O-methyltransferase [Pseudomonadota bacterium]MBU1708907.1 protein-glutamate O-methyltransferase [Pseudomonadota bacterium]